MCAVPTRTSRVCHIPQNGVINGCESPCSCWESNLGPLGEQPVLLNELSLQPCECLLFLSPKLLWPHSPPFTPDFDYLSFWIWFAKALFRISSPCPTPIGFDILLINVFTFTSLKSIYCTCAYVCICAYVCMCLCTCVPEVSLKCYFLGAGHLVLR